TRTNGSPTTYSKVTTDPIVNAGLPDSFAFPRILIAWSESILAAKTGATLFYNSSDTNAKGLVGWDYGSGRVASFSTLLTDTELGDANYKRLFGNMVRWVARDTAGLASISVMPALVAGCASA